MSTIDESIQFLQDTARDALRRAEFISNRIPTGGGLELRGGDFSFSPKVPGLQEPPKLSDLLTDVDTTEATARFLDKEAEAWLDKYFPELNKCLRDTPEKWLCGIITGEAPLGMSQAAFEAVWHEGRDRAYRAQRTETQQIKAAFSVRGFALPPGAMAAALSQSEERASDAIAAVNREQTNRDAEIKLDLLKFAEEQAIRLKLGIMQSMADFYRQWILMPDRDIERQRVKAQMYASFQGALSSYHNVELGFEQLRLRAAEAKQGALSDSDRSRIAAFSAAQPGAALASASNGFADIAASAANAQSTFAADILTGQSQ